MHVLTEFELFGENYGGLNVQLFVQRPNKITWSEWIFVPFATQCKGHFKKVGISSFC